MRKISERTKASSSNNWPEFYLNGNKLFSDVNHPLDIQYEVQRSSTCFIYSGKEQVNSQLTVCLNLI